MEAIVASVCLLGGFIPAIMFRNRTKDEYAMDELTGVFMLWGIASMLFGVLIGCFALCLGWGGSAAVSLVLAGVPLLRAGAHTHSYSDDRNGDWNVIGLCGWSALLLTINAYFASPDIALLGLMVFGLALLPFHRLIDWREEFLQWLRRKILGDERA